MNKGAIRLFIKLNNKNYIPKDICEIGVYLPEESNILEFINQGIPTTLVEADPNYINKIKSYFKDIKNLTVIQAAVFDFNGIIELCRRDSSTFISQLEASPALTNDNCNKEETEKFIAKSITFNEIDRGNFDLVSIDIEGAEWFVLKHMVSRPNVISIETHGKYYTNPNINNIVDWMYKNNYQKWYKDGSDTVYIKNGTFKISTLEKLQLTLKSFAIYLIKNKKPIKIFFKSIKSKIF